MSRLVGDESKRFTPPTPGGGIGYLASPPRRRRRRGDGKRAAAAQAAVALFRRTFRRKSDNHFEAELHRVGSVQLQPTVATKQGLI
jgi:hypothetical protein